MTKKKLRDLLMRYEKGACSFEERELIEKWMADHASDYHWAWENDAEKQQFRWRIKSGRLSSWRQKS